MKPTRAAELVLFATLLLSGRVLAESATPPASGTAPAAMVSASEQAPAWAFSALGYVYVVPESRDYLQPSLSLDHEVLHLEARYNYEDLYTASLWAGYTFSGGDELAWDIAPMFGGVFGRTSGVAPAYRGSLSFWKLELYSEGEYLFDFGDLEASFFYNWSELTLAPVEWFRFGVLTQRTRAYATERDTQRGLLVGFAYEIASLSVYVLNPDDSRPIVIVGFTLSSD